MEPVTQDQEHSPANEERVPEKVYWEDGAIHKASAMESLPFPKPKGYSKQGNLRIQIKKLPATSQWSYPFQRGHDQANPEY